ELLVKFCTLILVIILSVVKKNKLPTLWRRSPIMISRVSPFFYGGIPCNRGFLMQVGLHLYGLSQVTSSFSPFIFSVSASYFRNISAYRHTKVLCQRCAGACSVFSYFLKSFPISGRWLTAFGMRLSFCRFIFAALPAFAAPLRLLPPIIRELKASTLSAFSLRFWRWE